ncbi:MAG: hypothetical protein COW00_14390 [Bdellovibrio sp. CG12_big_fil_rev_8_21_14_0_65_39_13]|nr:MAG: hypothetical protein COW78_07865 [Bdellovibrio sp. CG22_combo_CG10-13_8_21_14_all_39_27]PIQ58802.1 MAG: hypothetical protein COW00_14390 [Bdellovibrio sp. CG12_big_fil_rev_8_21_14_0_65_39_13]PIR35517.1 MAG: hypothetical protein COV37_08560 [Bdellovibrio sp. CG11_big_fil_rev_8_21_14_0_20_39_38]PJB54350.1 MAG: hypothetical protein CO099_02045 [Bdellovibrio sp. CG_4_9_14_3_um_filter_39_7]
MKNFIIIFLLTISTSLYARIDKVEVYKSARRLDLISKGEVIKSFDVHLGSVPIGHKEQEGDGKTPEGSYKISWKNEQSQYHKGLLISYPNEADKQRARELGVEPGGAIYIHGMPNSIGKWRYLFWNYTEEEARELVYSFLNNFDWTQGCVAVTNAEIDEIFGLVREGTPIELFP